ncbi:hypothetical protein ES708_16469 [subsurface metagenome]
MRGGGSTGCLSQYRIPVLYHPVLGDVFEPGQGTEPKRFTFLPDIIQVGYGLDIYYDLRVFR